ncbi:hypothetical protein Adt_09775 [Abeliophyllum distichum]|uniref:Uncharacterized protein n=1 Tax=Abeliophyllum distichum TaxID=126358 RepID=A0ABD1UID3_9LAMI
MKNVNIGTVTNKVFKKFMDILMRHIIMRLLKSTWGLLDIVVAFLFTPIYTFWDLIPLYISCFIFRFLRLWTFGVIPGKTGPPIQRWFPFICCEPFVIKHLLYRSVSFSPPPSDFDIVDCIENIGKHSSNSSLPIVIDNPKIVSTTSAGMTVCTKNVAIVVDHIANSSEECYRGDAKSVGEKNKSNEGVLNSNDMDIVLKRGPNYQEMSGR